MKKLILCIFSAMLLFGCSSYEGCTFSGLYISKSGSRAFFKDFNLRYTDHDACFISKKGTIEICLSEVKELYIFTNESDLNPKSEDDSEQKLEAIRFEKK